MIRLSELRNQLKNQNLDTVQPASFKQVGGSVFPDNSARLDLDSLRDIITGFQAVHLPSYGHRIGGSPYAHVASINDSTSTKLLEPSINEVYVVDALNVASSESGTNFTLKMVSQSNVGSVAVALTRTDEIAPVDTEIPVLTIGRPIYVTYPQVLQIVTASSGSVDTSVILSYTKLQQ